MDILNILIVEDEITICNKYKKEATKYKKLNIVNSTGSSKQAISDINFFKPDAIILDLELHNGSGSGIDVLNYLQHCNYHPYVLIVTNNSSVTTHNFIRTLGADFILYKQQLDFREEYVLTFLDTQKSLIKEHIKQTTNKANITSTMNDCAFLNEIKNQFEYVGINPKHKGYDLLVDAVYISISYPSSDIYMQLSKKYKKNEDTIIRNMQYAINCAWNTTEVELLENHYKGPIKSDKGSPTLSDFIRYYANFIKKA